MNEEMNRNLGEQPIHQIMEQQGWSNHDLIVAMKPGFLTHKQVQKARKGRWLTPNIQQKIVTAVNACATAETYQLEELFTYRGKHLL
jgi:pyrroloquinoline quinone (PQQ) biosynthesis protein C